MENAPHITYHAIVSIYSLLWNYCNFNLTKFWSIFHDVFTSVTITVFPEKLWTPEKISGMLLVSQLFRCKMKPQKITRHETTSWLFLPQEIVNFTVFKYWNCSFNFLFQLLYMYKQRIDMNNNLRKSDVESSADRIRHS